MLVVVVRGDEGDDGAEDEPVADTLQQALCEEELPVAGDERGAEDSRHLHSAAYCQGVAEVAGVEGTAGEGADQVDEEDLDAAHPGNVAEGSVKGLNVVGLEEAPGANVAEDVEDNQVSGCNLSPCRPPRGWRRLLCGDWSLEWDVGSDIFVVVETFLLIQQPGAG